MKRGGEEEVLSSSLSSYQCRSPEEEQSRDIDTDSDVDSKKEPDWQKSLIAVTTEKDYEEDSGMTESRVSKAKLVASMSSSKVSPLRDLSTNWTGMRVAARRRRAGRRSRAAPCPRSSRAVC